MTDEIQAALVGVGGTALGIILGYVVNERSTIRREQRTEQRQARAVRKVLRLEIDHNRDTLKGWKPPARIPVQSDQMWKAQLPTVHASLTAEQIETVHRFYFDLYGLRKLYEQKVPDDQLRAAVEKFLARDHPLGDL